MSETKMLNLQWAINHAIAEEMRRDPSVFIVGEDVGKTRRSVWRYPRTD